jgi:FkbM family methyltransferase
MIYKIKLFLFKAIQKFFSIFNIKIFYSKDLDYFQSINLDYIIDVGVAEGTKFLNNRFLNTYYYLIEANDNYYPYLEKVFLKKYEGKLFKIGAGKEKNKKFFYKSGVTSSFLERENLNPAAKIQLQIDTLDNILKHEIISENTLLKIDCEGGELDVLIGANDILKKIKYLIIEIRLQKINTYNPSELINYIYKKGFFWESIIKVYYAKKGIDFIDVLFVKK